MLVREGSWLFEGNTDRHLWLLGSASAENRYRREWRLQGSGSERPTHWRLWVDSGGSIRRLRTAGIGAQRNQVTLAKDFRSPT